MSQQVLRTRLDYLKLFKKNLIDFFDEIIEQFPNDPDFIMTRIFIKDKMPIEEVMNGFLINFVPNEHLVDEKNDEKIIQLISSFGLEIPENKINKMVKLWKTELDEDDREVMWSLLKTFTTISKKYSVCEE